MLDFFRYLRKYFSVETAKATVQIPPLSFIIQTVDRLQWGGIINYFCRILSRDIYRGAQSQIAPNTSTHLTLDRPLMMEVFQMLTHIINNLIFGIETKPLYSRVKELRRMKYLWINGKVGEHKSEEEKAEGEKRWRDAVDRVSEEDAYEVITPYTQLNCV